MKVTLKRTKIHTNSEFRSVNIPRRTIAFTRAGYACANKVLMKIKLLSSQPTNTNAFEVKNIYTTNLTLFHYHIKTENMLP